MENLSENLIIANQIKAEVKHQVICSNDIIARSLMPAIYADYINLYRTIFGAQRVQQYLVHADFLSSVRNLIHQASCQAITQSPRSSASLAIARYGAGECQEIASLCYDKLLAKKLRKVAFIALQAPKCPGRITPMVHCLVLLGDDALRLYADGDIRLLNQLPDHVVALDAYLDYVGPANRYLQEQLPYLNQFKYHKIAVCDRPSEIHFQNQSHIHENVEKLAMMVAHDHFYRNFLNLSLNCFSIGLLLPCHETALVECLNAASGLVFGWGHQELRVTAYTDVSLEADLEKAKALQDTLQAGTFYHQSAKSFFVLHQINVQPNLGKRITQLASGPKA